MSTTRVLAALAYLSVSLLAAACSDGGAIQTPGAGGIALENAGGSPDFSENEVGGSFAGTQPIWTARAPQARTLCSPCVSDRQCGEGFLCAPTVHAPTGVDAGYFCQVLQSAFAFDAKPGGDCWAVPPFIRSKLITSIDGTMAAVCSLARSTCQAVEDRARGFDCGGDSDSCGLPGVADASCVASSTAHRCREICSLDEDCDPLSSYRCVLPTGAEKYAHCELVKEAAKP